MHRCFFADYPLVSQASSVETVADQPDIPSRGFPAPLTLVSRKRLLCQNQYESVLPYIAVLKGDARKQHCTV